MIRKPLTCPVCGDVWKRVLHENFLRLGPPVRECRACWTPFATDAKEWDELDGSSRIAYFLQNVVTLVPLLLLLGAACGVLYLLGWIAPTDLEIEFLYGCAALFGLFCLLMLWSMLMIVRSKRRQSRRRQAGAAASLRSE